MSHTPGPWFASDLGIIYAIDEDGEVIQTGSQYMGGTAWANARLIAGAPELLAALRRLLGTSGCGECEEQYRKPCVYCEARAAIAKAEGKP